MTWGEKVGYLQDMADALHCDVKVNIMESKNIDLASEMQIIDNLNECLEVIINGYVSKDYVSPSCVFDMLWFARDVMERTGKQK